MNSIHRPIFNSSSSHTKLLVTILNAPVKISITITLMFHCFFSFLARSKYVNLFSFSLNSLSSARMGSSTNSTFTFFFFSSFFLIIITMSGLLAWIRWSVLVSKSPRILCISLSRTDSCLCMNRLMVWSNFNFLVNSEWITFPIQSCLVFYSFRSNLLHWLVMWLIVSSLSPHNLHFLICCTIIIFPLIYNWSLWLCFVLLLE